MKHSGEDFAQITCLHGEPEACYQRWRESLHAEEALLLVNFTLMAYWLEHTPVLELTAIYCVSGDALQISVTDRTLKPDGLAPRQQYVRWVRRYQLLSYESGNPVPLVPQPIVKPWGQEIWYTAVERRGVCSFGRDKQIVPIPWLQAALPGSPAGTPGEPLLLLKILAPSALPILGDLYFELHETKYEAYVVTDIDPEAWPDGIGYLRCGFDPLERAAYPSDDAFRQAYLASVLAYRKQRRKLDGLAQEGVEATRQECEREQSLREDMDRFTLLLPLRVGDVIRVPPLLPHALQHGVRVIEVQTPSYERKIISFAQKVLTQEDWDSCEAVPRMLLEPPAMPIAAIQPALDNAVIESIVDFPDFDVVRVRLGPGASWVFEAGSSYRLLMVVKGVLAISGSLYRSEEALLLPHSWCGVLAAPETASELVFLLARPRR